MRADNCPIERQRDLLAAAGMDAAELDAVRIAARDEMRRALEAAKAAPWPADDTVFDDVQTVGSPAAEAR